MYTVYKITNKINGKFYIGVHKTKHPNDQYYGSGRSIKNSIKKYGKENFRKEILYLTCVKTHAYEFEKRLLESIWDKSGNYNMNSGGHGSWDYVNLVIKPENPMKNPKTILKNIEKRRKNGTYHTEKVLNACIQNLKKAVEKNSGTKQSKECVDKRRKSLIMYNKNLSLKEKEDRAKALTTNRDNYILTDTKGNPHFVTQVAKWAAQNNFPLSTIVNCKDEKLVKRGKLKGWFIKRIEVINE